MSSHHPIVESLPVEWLTKYSYALLNPLNVEQDDWKGLPAIPLAPTKAKMRPHVLPQLISLKELSHDDRKTIFERILRYQKRGVSYFCALLASHATADDVAAHLKHHLVQRRPGDPRHWWLRYYDPHVFRHFSWIFEPEQVDRLLGPITEWVWPDEKGQWYCRSHRPYMEASIFHLMPTSSQWKRIDNVVEVNRMIDHLVIRMPQLHQSPSLWALIDHLFEKADDVLSSEDTYGRILFVEQGVRFHPQIHSHPILAERIACIQGRGVDYREVCFDLDEVDMKRMAGEVNKQYYTWGR